MRTSQIISGALFLTCGLALMIGKKKLVQRSCWIKSRFLPKCFHGTLKEFADAGPEVYFYWGVSNALAGSLMLITAMADCLEKNDI